LYVSEQLEADQPLALGGHGALDEVEVVEGDAGAHGDAFEGVVGDVAGDADLLGDQAVLCFELARANFGIALPNASATGRLPSSSCRSQIMPLSFADDGGSDRRSGYRVSSYGSIWLPPMAPTGIPKAARLADPVSVGHHPAAE